MARKPQPPADAHDIFTEMLRAQGEAARQMMGAFLPEAADAVPSDAELTDWGQSALKLQQMWFDFHRQQAIPEMPVPIMADPLQWIGLMQGWFQQVPLLDPRRQAEIFEEGMALWEGVLAQYGVGPKAAEAAPGEVQLPRQDRRFADPAWRD